MPLEISEIGVRLAVGLPTNAAAPKDGNGAACGATRVSPQQFDDLVRTCVREVLDTLRMIEGR